MRTTVTLDPDVAAQLKELAHRQRKPFKAVLNDSIRNGLRKSAFRPPRKPVRVKTYPLQLRPGIDPAGLNQLADELEAEEILKKMMRGR